MKKMEKHKKRDHNKSSFSLSNSKMKRYYTEMVSMNNKECIEHYLKVREQKFNQMKYYTRKTVTNVKQEITPVKKVKADRIIDLNDINPTMPSKTDRIISLDSDMKLDKTFMNKSYSMTSLNKNNDRLVIELKDYLTLTKTKNILKFKLKPISDKPELSSVKDIIKTANTFQFNQILNYGQSYEEPQRSFLLVPQDKADTVKDNKYKESKMCKKQVNRKKSKVVLASELNNPIRTCQKLQQINHKKSSIQVSNKQKCVSTKKVCAKPVDTKQPEPKVQLPQKESHSVINVSKKVQRNNIHSDIVDAIKPIAKGKNKVVLKSHPYFSKHKPFVIKHRPAVTNVTTHQNNSAIIQEENLEIDLDTLFKNDELIDGIKFEVPEQELNFVMSQDSEGLNQIFPVALKSNDSHDFEYLGFETDNEISTESEMQILGI